uniref:Uncharacterized protein n=1 Tax=Knipowitschia caucasica TaxID=637954 RepID=A0AAV2KKJ2_KNICA
MIGPRTIGGATTAGPPGASGRITITGTSAGERGEGVPRGSVAPGDGLVSGPEALRERPSVHIATDVQAVAGESPLALPALPGALTIPPSPDGEIGPVHFPTPHVGDGTPHINLTHTLITTERQEA